MSSNPLGNDVFIELEERFDANVLNHILKNRDKFDPMIVSRRPNYEDYDIFGMAQRYLNLSHDGHIKTKYKQNNGYGRFYAVQSMSLQSITRNIRHSIARDYYIDIDIVNCHPIILEHLCIQNNYPHKNLSHFIKNRDKILSEHSEGKSVAKIGYLALTNGGTGKEFKATEFSKKYAQEMKNIHALFAMDNEEAYTKHKDKRKKSGKDFNHQASFMNTILCEHENSILMAMWNFFKRPSDCVFVFDGMMLPKSKGPYDLSKCEQFVMSKTKIKVSIVKKSMDEHIDMSNELIEPYYADDVKLFDKVTQKIVNDVLMIMLTTQPYQKLYLWLSERTSAL